MRADNLLVVSMPNTSLLSCKKNLSILHLQPYATLEQNLVMKGNNQTNENKRNRYAFVEKYNSIFNLYFKYCTFFILPLKILFISTNKYLQQMISNVFYRIGGNIFTQIITYKF